MANIIYRTYRLIPLLVLAVIVTATVVAASEEYAVGEGDLLRISVYGHPDLATEARIGGDGRITFPLIGQVRVDGLTTKELEELIAVSLEDGYIRKAHVTVFIREYKSKKVTVLGEFTRPGIVELRGDFTLLEVISSAGGITANAGDTLFIRRKPAGGETGKGRDPTVTVDLKRLLESGDITANEIVRDGDSIYVPRAAFVFVTGEVVRPGTYKITKDLTVLKAITLAGGFTEKASKKKTVIIRKDEVRGEAKVNASMDDFVLSDDVILVPESLF